MAPKATVTVSTPRIHEYEIFLLALGSWVLRWQTGGISVTLLFGYYSFWVVCGCLSRTVRSNWSDSCMELEPMLADMSLRYSSSSLQFGRIDVNKWSDVAVENRISVSTVSWQLPTLILFQDGEEVMRLPPIDDNGKVTKMILDRARLIAVFKLKELKEGKSVVFKPKLS
ncbi:unnamed protein product [Peronospora destructor]|uniref:Thioredoxin domain-containing protein n=1 Tax=Peronospora destructor TaxID=86335 RepID=A0AAV0V593_9STRA|nr:unnamed protein product [Peronospora destructor]